jgi:O-glycosyl hydrolase
MKKASAALAASLLLAVSVACGNPASSSAGATGITAPAGTTALTSPPPALSDDGTGVVTVDLSATRQTIDGFGGCNAWTGLPADSTAQTQVVKLLFSTTEGIGLSLIRNRIPFRESTTYDDAFLTKDATSHAYTYQATPAGHKTFNLNWSNWDLQNTKTLFGLAKAYSSDIRGFSTPWTPPNNQYDHWKINDGANTIGGTMGDITTWPDIGGILDSAHYQDYADVLADYAANFQANMGYPLAAISIQNEPNWLPKTYESCGWNASQFHAFLPDLASAFSAKGVSVPVIAPESYSFTEDLVVPSLNDAATAPVISIVGVHQYSGSAAFLATTKGAGKRLWETEISSGSSNDSSITDGLHWAGIVQSDMTVAEANAFCYWWLWTNSGSPTKGSLINVNGTTVTDNKRLYTVGQFSRFIRPGWVRLNSELNPTLSVSSSVYCDPNSTKIAIVLINSSTGDSGAITLKLAGTSTFASLGLWETDASDNLASKGAVTANGNSASISVPAQTVATVYGTVNP